MEIDRQNRVRLSMKETLEKPKEEAAPQAASEEKPAE